MTASIDPLGRTTTTAYDAVDNVTQVTDPRSAVTVNSYDALDRLVALVAPAATRPAITARINRELNEILRSADAREALQAQGVEPEPGAPELLTERIRTDIDKWRGVVAKAGIRTE